MALLEVSNLGIAFGGLQAVSQLDLKIEKGHLYGLIGPNGAGKTTVFNMLTGVYEPTEGNIVLDGNDITGATPEAISKAGIARTFQNIRLFNDMTVLDNVKVGLHNQVVYGMWTGILRLPSFREKEHEMDRRAMKLLKIFDLDAEANYKASQLPYGKQRKLEIARALATNPKLLLLDEPAAGMNPNETEELMPAAEKLAETIAKNAPIAVRACKKAINDGLQVDMDKAIVIEEELFGSCFQSADQIEGMSAFLEKRKHEPYQNK